ncbi:hypothetical protein TeGR_g5241, partial [Tetraparma gracilis]
MPGVTRYGHGHGGDDSCGRFFLTTIALSFTLSMACIYLVWGKNPLDIHVDRGCPGFYNTTAEIEACRKQFYDDYQEPWSGVLSLMCGTAISISFLLFSQTEPLDRVMSCCCIAFFISTPALYAYFVWFPCIAIYLIVAGAKGDALFNTMAVAAGSVVVTAHCLTLWFVIAHRE